MIIRPATILILFLSLMALSGYSAVKLDFNMVDRLTYRCYNEQKWDSVILVGKQALKQDIDYYYLRVRLGISYFNKRQYYPSSAHLEKARRFNSGDPLVADYLYRAYLYTNREEEARSLRPSLPEQEPGRSEKEEDNSTGFISAVHFETGYTLSSDASPTNLATLTGTDSIYGEQDLYGNNLYVNLGLKLRVSNHINVSLAYNYLDFSKTKYIRYGHTEDHLLNIADSSWGKMYIWSFPYVYHDTSFSYHVRQHEAHLGITWSLPGGFKIMPAFHLLAVSYPLANTRVSSDTVTNPGFFINADSILVTFPFTRTNYSFTQKDTSFFNYVIALRVTKDLGIFNLGLHGSWSNLNNKTQYQAGASLTYYPLGNLSFYGTTTVTGFFQKKVTRLLFSQVLGAKITPWMWAEGNFYYGDFTNANIFNGSVVYNNSDMIDYRAGASLVFPAGRHIQFSLLYQYFRKESQQIYYIHNADNTINKTPQIQNNPYNTNTIIGGVTWKL